MVSPFFLRHTFSPEGIRFFALPAQDGLPLKMHPRNQALSFNPFKGILQTADWFIGEPYGLRRSRSPVLNPLSLHSLAYFIPYKQKLRHHSPTRNVSFLKFSVLSMQR
jgi:hypothetical protein